MCSHGYSAGRNECRIKNKWAQGVVHNHLKSLIPWQRDPSCLYYPMHNVNCDSKAMNMFFFSQAEVFKNRTNMMLFCSIGMFFNMKPLNVPSASYSHSDPKQKKMRGGVEAVVPMTEAQHYPQIKHSLQG